MKSLSTLQIALGISLAVHAALLTFRFVDPERFDRVFQDSPLEVILVNAKSDGRPDKAQAIAQASLAGGGNLERGLATSPLPFSALTALGDSTDDSQRKVDSMQEQQTQLLSQIKKELASLPPPDLKPVGGKAALAEREEKRKQLIKILAAIEKRINEENARPKKRYISPATLAGVHAIYYSRVKDVVEALGTQNFPLVAGRKLYGELTMLISLDSKGQVLQTEVVQSSGIKGLDRMAQAIVRAGAPYGNFTPAMLREFRIMVVSWRFRFTRDETLEAHTVPITPFTP